VNIIFFAANQLSTDASDNAPTADRGPIRSWVYWVYWAIAPLLLTHPIAAAAASPASGAGFTLYAPAAKTDVAKVARTPKSPLAELSVPEREMTVTEQASPLPTATATPVETAPLVTADIATVAADLTAPTSVPLAAIPVASSPTAGPDSSPLIAQTATTGAYPWQFSIEPYVYFPFGASGDITVNDITAPIDAGIGDIFDAAINDLNFAAFGRAEAWNGPWGLLFDGIYMDVSTGETAVIDVPPDLQLEGLPPQITTEAAVSTSYAKLDLAGAYRFGDGNLPNALRTADTEFDLGPFFFDAIAGLRVYFFNNELVLTNDLGGRAELDQSRTIAEPMIGGRARWNLADDLAVITGASISGFGLGDLTFSIDGYAGVDWLFSGNTSLLAAYRLTYVDYSSGSSGLNLFTHGPTVGMKFRF
jgi:hypothetical protein